MADKILSFKIDVQGVSNEVKQLSKIDIELAKLNAERRKYLKTLKTEKKLTKEEVKGFQRVTNEIIKNKKERTDLNKKIRDTNKANQKGVKSTNTWRKAMGSFAAKFNTIGNIAANAVQNIVQSIKAAVRESIKLTAEFERGQANVQTLLDKFDSTLKGGTLDLIKKYGLEIADVNKALFDAVSAGVPAANAIDFLGVASKLSIGGVTNLTTAVDGITSVINAYGLSISEAEQVSSAFFSAQKFGKTTVAELSDQIGQVAPIASTLNISYQELLSTYAELTKQGIKTEQATTGIKATLTALAKPTKEAKDLFNELGIDTGVVAIQQNGLLKTLVQVAGAIEEDGDRLTELIPNVRALTAVGALGSRQLEDYEKILKVVNEDYGKGSSLAKAYATQQNTLAKSMERIKAGFAAAKISVGRFFTPLIKGFANVINPIEAASSALIEQRDNLNLLVGAATQANASEEARLVIIKDIQKAYPDFLKNIDAEKITNEDLKTALEGVNEEYEKKIELAVLSEEKASVREEGIELKRKERDLLKELTIAQQKYEEAKQGDAADIFGGTSGIVQGEIEGINRRLERTQTKLLENAEANALITQEYRDQEKLVKSLFGSDEGGVGDGGGDGGGGGKVDGKGDGKSKIVEIKKQEINDLDMFQEAAFEKDINRLIDFSDLQKDEADEVLEEYKRLWDLEAFFYKRKTDKQIQADNDKRTLQEQNFDAINSLVAASGNLFEAAKQRELAAAGDNAEKREEIERKYNNKQKAIALAQVAINTAVAISAALKLPVLAPLVIPGIIATGLSQAAIIAAQKFADGGKVQSGNELPQSTPQGDNTLALVKPGEVVLNSVQQSALGGDRTFKNIGVPGFASGGRVPGVAPQPLANSDPSLMANSIARALSDINVRLDVNKLNSAQSELEVINSTNQL